MIKFGAPQRRLGGRVCFDLRTKFKADKGAELRGVLAVGSLGWWLRFGAYVMRYRCEMRSIKLTLIQRLWVRLVRVVLEGFTHEGDEDFGALDLLWTVDAS